MCLVILVLISWSVLSLWITFACLIPHFHPWTGFQRRSTSWEKKVFAKTSEQMLDTESQWGKWNQLRWWHNGSVPLFSFKPCMLKMWLPPWPRPRLTHSEIYIYTPFWSFFHFMWCHHHTPSCQALQVARSTFLQWDYFHFTFFCVCGLKVRDDINSFIQELKINVVLQHHDVWPWVMFLSWGTECEEDTQEDVHSWRSDRDMSRSLRSDISSVPRE